jgi:hypothetical protein
MIDAIFFISLAVQYAGDLMVRIGGITFLGLLAFDRSL